MSYTTLHLSYTNFTTEQLAHVARANMQQNELLRHWLQTERDRHCDHSNVGNVFTTGRNFYRACRDCGARLEYSLEQESIQRRACASAPPCAWQRDLRSSHS